MNESVFPFDSYTEKINSIGCRLKEAVGHPFEQMRLVLQLKVYINSMINDLNKTYETFSTSDFESLFSLYEVVFGILVSIPNNNSGITISIPEYSSDNIIEKFRNLLCEVDKVMRYLDNLNKPVKESTTFFEEINSVTESDLSYKVMRKFQTNKIALHNQRMMQKNLCEKKYKECKGKPDQEEEFKNWLLKQKRLVQKKINGNEIKNKDSLRKNIALYDSYLSKLGVSTSANESSIYYELGIATEDVKRSRILQVSHLDTDYRLLMNEASRCKTNEQKLAFKKKLRVKKSQYEDQLYNMDSKFPDDRYPISEKNRYRSKLEKLIDFCNSPSFHYHFID